MSLEKQKVLDILIRELPYLFVENWDHYNLKLILKDEYKFRQLIKSKKYFDKEFDDLVHETNAISMRFGESGAYRHNDYDPGWKSTYFNILKIRNNYLN